MPKLEMWSIIKQAYRTAVTPVLWRGAIVWAVVFAAFTIIDTLVLSQSMPDPTLDPSAPLPKGLIVSVLVSIAATLITGAGMAVNVNRHILLGDAPHLFRLGEFELSYIWRTIKIAVRFTIAAIIVELGAVLLILLFYMLMPEYAEWSGIALAFGVMLLVGGFLSPYLLVLPSVSIANYSFYFDDAMIHGRSQRWRILGIMIGGSLPMIIVSLVLSVLPLLTGQVHSLHEMAMAGSPQPEVTLTATLLQLPVQIFSMLLQPACMAYIYRALVQRPMEPEVLPVRS